MEFEARTRPLDSCYFEDFEKLTHACLHSKSCSYLY